MIDRIFVPLRVIAVISVAVAICAAFLEPKVTAAAASFALSHSAFSTGVQFVQLEEPNPALVFWTIFSWTWACAFGWAIVLRFAFRLRRWIGAALSAVLVVYGFSSVMYSISVVRAQVEMGLAHSGGAAVSVDFIRRAVVTSLLKEWLVASVILFFVLMLTVKASRSHSRKVSGADS